MYTVGFYILLFFALFLVVATLLPHLRAGFWWVQAAAFPRMQLAVLIVVDIALLLVFYRDTPVGIVAAVLLVLCLIHQIGKILPYTRLTRVESLSATKNDRDGMISIVISNVHQSNRDAQRIISIIRQRSPDLVLLLETDIWWRQQLSILEQEYPHGVFEPRDNTYGMILLSQLPLRDTEINYLVSDSIPSIETTVELRSGIPVRFIGVHPVPPVPWSGSETRDAELVLVGRHVDSSGIPTIIAGDFNDVAWSQTTNLFQKLSHTLDPRVGRGMYNTFHADYFFLRFPLDHVFHTPEFKIAEIERLENIGSDHFPVYSALSYAPDPESERRTLESGPEEQEEADDRVRQGKKAAPEADGK